MSVRDLSGEKTVRVTKDLLAGAMFMVFGLGGAVIATGYGMGTAARMGPGYFPVALGMVIALLGAVMSVKALLNPDSSEPIEAGKLRPILFISLAILAFGLLIDGRGLIAAVVALVVIARFAGREGSALEVLAITALLTVIATAIFVWGLNIPLKLRPW